MTQVDILDYQLLYTSFFTDSTVRNLNTPDPSTGLMGAIDGAAMISQHSATNDGCMACLHLALLSGPLQQM